MLPTRRHLFIVAVVCVGLVSALGSARGADIADCPATPTFSLRLDCVLWDIAGFTRAQPGESRTRTTGRVSLPSGRAVITTASYNQLSSSWPDALTFEFYEQGEQESRIIERITDQGLDGLNPEDLGDEYIRFNEIGRPDDLLRSLDPHLKEPLNEDYQTRAAEILAALNQRESVHGPVNWKLLRPGLEVAEVTAFRYIRLGMNEVRLLRVDAGLYDFVPYSREEQAEYRALHIEAWARVLPRAAAIFNAGQYYPDYRHMGLLVKDGRNLGTDIHPRYKALLVSGRVSADAGPPAAIVDLAQEPRPPDESYKYAVQSFMLLDETGRVRVRRTDRLASRTVVAVDTEGRIVCVWVPGAASLYELALWLKESGLNITRAMCLDGGFESQAVVREPQGDLVTYGAWVVNEQKQYFQRLLKLPLPSVIAVVPHDPDQAPLQGAQ